MRVDAEPNQVVRDEAVEQRTEDVLGIQRKRRLQAEERVRGDSLCGEYGRDERQPVGGTCNIPVGKTRPSRDPNARASAELIATPFDGRSERIDLFALEHRTARRVAIERRKEVTVVRRIEFAAERDVPAFVQRRHASADALEHLKINRAANVGTARSSSPDSRAMKARVSSTSFGLSGTGCSRSSGRLSPKRHRTVSVGTPLVAVIATNLTLRWMGKMPCRLSKPAIVSSPA